MWELQLWKAEMHFRVFIAFVSVARALERNRQIEQLPCQLWDWHDKLYFVLPIFLNRIL